MARKRQLTLFDGARRTLEQAVELSIASLSEYGQRYDHWAVAYSGGKDSSATVSFLAWALAAGRLQWPKSITVLYADTRLELPPLQHGAMELMRKVGDVGMGSRVVRADIDNRFLVYMLGRGDPPPGG